VGKWVVEVSGCRWDTWMNDTSMALCLAENLIERREFNPVDQMA